MQDEARPRLPELIPDNLLAYATPAELVAYEEALRVHLALSGPLAYAQYVSPGTHAYAHLELLDRTITALIEHRLYVGGIGPAAVLEDGASEDEEGVWRRPGADGRYDKQRAISDAYRRRGRVGDPGYEGEVAIIRLAVSMPPRHGKSYTISEHLPPWFLTKYPDRQVILASYEADFAATWGRKARTHVEEHPEFGVRVSSESRSGARWDLDGTRGGMVTAGVGGPITGKGAHLLVVDDPTKNAEEALSATTRQAHIDWWYSTAWTRREPGGVAIIVATRWHEGDLIGHLTEAEAGKWYVINLPALAFDTVDEEGFSYDADLAMRDPLGRRPGQALCPARYTRSDLLDIQEGNRLWFASLYQGRPNIEGGGLFPKPYVHYRLIGSNYEMTDKDGVVTNVSERECIRFATADLAASTKTSADWTVFAVWDVTPDRRLILRARYRERLESSNHHDKLVEMHEKYQPRYWAIENRTFGMSLIQNLLKSGDAPVRPVEADTDKIARALGAGAAVAAGRVYFPAEVDWLEVWEDELTKFPNGRHDDQVDTLAYAVIELDKMPRHRKRDKEPETYDEKVEAHRQQRAKGKPKRTQVPGLGRW